MQQKREELASHNDLAPWQTLHGGGCIVLRQPFTNRVEAIITCPQVNVLSTTTFNTLIVKEHLSKHVTEYIISVLTENRIFNSNGLLVDIAVNLFVIYKIKLIK